MQKDNSLHTRDENTKTNTNMNENEAISIYLDVRKGKLERFPAGFFSDNGVLDTINVCIPVIKFLIEEILHWDDEDICNNLTRRTFHDNKLGGMLSHHFSDSPYEAINLAYPGRFNPWELKGCMRNYWNDETAVEATHWLIEKKLKLTDEEILNVQRSTFKENGLSGMLRSVFDDSAHKAICKSYPEKFTRSGKNLVLKSEKK